MKPVIHPFCTQVRVGTVTNNLRFPGQYYDAETGFHYNWNRYYDPETGRYLSPDPIGLEGGLNLYAYVENDPVNWSDPEGLIRWTGTFRQGSLAAGIGSTFIKYIMVSDCVDNKKAIVTVYAVGPTGAAGVELSLTDGTINMHDFNKTIRPNSFNGVAVILSGTISVLKGYSMSTTTLGNVYSDKILNFGAVKGSDFSIGLTFGSSTVWDVVWEDCCQE